MLVDSNANANANDSQLYVSPGPMTSPNFRVMSQNSGDFDAATSVRRLRPLMGTFCAIEVTGNVDSLAEVVNGANAVMQRVNDLMHPVNGADLSRINKLLAQVIQVDALTWQVLQLAKHINDYSNGVFDPCLPTHTGCMRDVELLPDNQLICHAPVMMDLGGIAKGFAVDCAMNVLIEAGCSSGLVNAGGDIRVFGEMQLMCINRGDQVLRIELYDQALAVSQFNYADRPKEHQGYYRRNLALSAIHEHVAVVAPSAAVADALTKCVMWEDAKSAENLCRKFKAKLLFAEG